MDDTGTGHDDVLAIDCAECTGNGTPLCEDCLVTFICGSGPVVVDLDEHRAMRLLGEHGLVPRLRHHRRTG